MQVPPLFHAVDLHTQVKLGSLYAASEPLQMVQTVAFAQDVQLLLHA